MIRMATASVFGFVLIVIESFIVMKWKGYTAIQFGDMGQFVSVWAMNFFLVFAMLTHFKMWLESREDAQETQIER